MPGPLFLAAFALAGPWLQTEGGVEARAFGHSAHGAPFDEGPRQRPWKMEGIGRTQFPITTSVPEVQEWFDQGNTLLHNFWWFEAERCFRWCLKLDPECAMAYWGLARTERASGEGERQQEFLKEAVRRKASVTPRERMYIEAWEEAFLPEYAREVREEEGQSGGDSWDKLAEGLEQIVLAYPEDVEAKALLALASLYSAGRYGNDAVLREVLEKEPEHPGAHHYRIHNWDGKDGAYALDACEAYGRIAWGSGHANHMPGHIYSGIGMWHEGAIWMDSATRVEKRYMEERMTLPFHNWNYAHNRNYLSYIQEQLGLPSLALDGARQLLAAPLDPKYNAADERYGIHREGLRALVRALVKFERWETILEEGAIPWRGGKEDKLLRAYAESLAHLGRGELDQGVESHVALKKLEGELSGNEQLLSLHARMRDELAGRIALARGERLDGLLLLSNAAEAQSRNYRKENDPPLYPYLLYTVLGDAYLDGASPGLAADCFEKTLEVNPNDAFALAGLTCARHALGELEAAQRAYGKLLAVWSDAEPELRGQRWLGRCEALGLVAEPLREAPRPERSYSSETLAPLGPETWRPYAAPALEARDAAGAAVTLDEYRGKLVLLVFYLGERCVHCVEQLAAIGARAPDFEKRGVELVAVGAAVPEAGAAPSLDELPFRLLADPDHANARRFHAYDDFEELELHATVLIDRAGRIRWSRTGGDPFNDFDFLLAEIERVEKDADLGGSAAAPQDESAASAAPATTDAAGGSGG